MSVDGVLGRIEAITGQISSLHPSSATAKTAPAQTTAAGGVAETTATATTSSSAATRFADLLEEAAAAARELGTPTTSATPASASTATRPASQGDLAAALQTLFAAGTTGSGGLGVSGIASTLTGRGA
ncbi:hypothetical protein ACFZA2_02365 [Microbacterium sp. NPDC007973]|uniref:hypothetical protein n=1 Tax=Microbacterium sp. NPDC007973 TaxID=3364182 RepID=UPI0036E91281